MWGCFTPLAGGLCGKHTWSVSSSQQLYIGQLAQACCSQLARTPRRAQQYERNLQQTLIVCGQFRALRALVGLPGLFFLGSQPWPWPWPWTQWLHLSSALAWAMVQVCPFPVLPSGWALGPHCSQHVSWMDASDGYDNLFCLWPFGLWSQAVALFPVLSLSPFTPDRAPWVDPGPGSSLALSGVFDRPYYWFLALTPWSDPVGLCHCRTVVARSRSLITEPCMTMRPAICNSRKGSASTVPC